MISIVAFRLLLVITSAIYLIITRAAFADEIANLRITGPSTHKDFSPDFNIPVEFDFTSDMDGSSSGRIECWRVRRYLFDKFPRDAFEGSKAIKVDGLQKSQAKHVSETANCNLHDYAGTDDEYYVQLFVGSATSVKAKHTVSGVSYPIYMEKKDYEEKKTIDGMTVKECLANDIEQVQRWTDLSPQWTVEPIATVQLVRYTFRTHKTALNAQGLGAGITFKYYPQDMMIGSEPIDVSTKKDGKDYVKFDGSNAIYKIKTACRATSFDQTNKLAASLLSIGPVMFVSKADTTSDVSVQAGGILGFFENLVQIGFGVNVSPNKHMDPFIMIGFGKGFNVSGTK